MLDGFSVVSTAWLVADFIVVGVGLIKLVACGVATAEPVAVGAGDADDVAVGTAVGMGVGATVGTSMMTGACGTKESGALVPHCGQNLLSLPC